MSTARPRIQATPTCSLRASGAIICPKDHATAGKERYCTRCDCRYYAHAKPKLAANRLVGRLRRRKNSSPSPRCVGLVVLPLPCCVPISLPRSVWAARDHPRREKDRTVARAAPSTACARPPTRPQGSLWGSCFYWAQASSLRELSACWDPVPLMVLWDANFKEKGGGQACGHERLARRALGNR